MMVTVIGEFEGAESLPVGRASEPLVRVHMDTSAYFLGFAEAHLFRNGYNRFRATFSIDFCDGLITWGVRPGSRSSRQAAALAALSRTQHSKSWSDWTTRLGETERKLQAQEEAC